ncbi:MAG TPA: carbohydrate binding domain-containing protein [Thermoguttaceae bacterium]|nr:carbohydrate binding domain-containing protein [Thermoguttaceae bacterium]
MLCKLMSVIVAVACSAPSLRAAEFFVRPDGSDSNPGSIEAPFATLAKAANSAGPGDTCYLREGVYRETLAPARSGRPGEEITFTVWQDEKVVISGADAISDWKDEGDGVLSAPMPWCLGEENQIFANGQMSSEACWPAPGASPLFQPKRAVASGGSETTLVCEEIPGGDDAWKHARLWCAGGSAWICWTLEVTGYDAASHTLTFEDAQRNWYIPRAGSLFVLKGLRSSLRAPGQWFYDATEKRLLIIPPTGADIKTLAVEAKRRSDAIDLSGLSHIRIEGIGVRAAGVRTDENSSHIVLDRLQGRYVAHADVSDVHGKSGILLHGHDILLLSSDLGYSSSSVVSVQGHDNRVINCHIHHGGYGGLWRGTVVLSGRRIVFSHNTVRHAGRDLINTHGLMESLLQYNDVSEAGWLTKDLGMFYGHNTDFANTVFRYNLVHDNHAEHCAMGIYFDHLSHNAIVHHNVIWNVGMDPTRINNPSYNCLVFNNTCRQTGLVGTFDHSKRNDLFASRYFNNIYNEPPRIDWMNVVRNACFEFGTLEGWEKTNAERAELVGGNGWGNAIVGSDKAHATGTSKYELRLGPGRDGVQQAITGLSPNVTYTLSAWFRVSDASESVALGVRNHGGGEFHLRASDTDWTRRSIEFTTGPDSTEATIYLLKSSDGAGHAWCDNVTLPLRPSADR